MFTYVCLGTNDLARATLFYDAAFADFYAAYVRDPDGNELAAVCRGFTKPQ